MGEKRTPYKLLMRKPKGEIPIGPLGLRPRHRRIDNIKIDLVQEGVG
jgi:hypothetical protein